jgi:predicted methyltransferase
MKVTASFNCPHTVSITRPSLPQRSGLRVISICPTWTPGKNSAPEYQAPLLRQAITTPAALAPFDEADFPAADASYNFLSYHDLPAYGSDTAATNARLFNALRPVGKYLIIDHLAEDESEWRYADTIHRIDKNVIIKEVVAAGFELLTDSPLLAHHEDPRTAGVYELRGATDRAVLLFQKPY